MRRPSVPIIAWVVSGLVVVAALPIVVAWFQIDRNIGSIIGQTQKTHQIFARSTADRLASSIGLLQSLMRSAGDDPDLYLEPTSARAQGVLVELFERMQGARSVSLYLRRAGEDVLVYSARTPGATSPAPEQLAAALDAPPELTLVDGRYLLRLQVPTSRPNLFLHALVDLAPMEELLKPAELGDASELLLVDRSGRVVVGREGAFALIPEHMREAISLDAVASGNNSFRDARTPVVYGFSRVGELPLRVVSLQPALQAETARLEMRQTALLTFAGIAVAVLLLSTGAWFLVVRPIRQIVSAQRQLMGGKMGSGSEISQLRDSFDRLEGAIRDRDELSEVFLGRYQVLRRIGSGAMGTVYLGWDPKLERNVALKTIKYGDRIQEQERTELTARLLREGVRSARLTHANVVTVYDVLGDERGAFLAMEYVEGPSLEERIQRLGKLPPEQVRRVAEGVLRALDAAHGQGIIHRDIKPANVLLAPDGEVKVTDFGIAGFMNEASEGARVVLGTPGYLAPEAYRSGAFGVRTDLFAVGVLLAECLLGEDVFPGRNTQQIIARTQARQVVFPPQVGDAMPEELMTLVQRLLEKDPDARPGNAREALALLGIQLEEAPVLGSGDDDGSARRTDSYASHRDAATARIELDDVRDGG